MKSQAELDLIQKIKELNRLKDYSIIPRNVVLVTIEDIVELVYSLRPYTMSRLDDAYALTHQAQAGGEE